MEVQEKKERDAGGRGRESGVKGKREKKGEGKNLGGEIA